MEVMMYPQNPFASLAGHLSPQFMRIYIVLMVLAVLLGTFFDVYHKGSGKFFARRREKAKAAARHQLSAIEILSVGARTFGEVAVSAEFCKRDRRLSHLLMMYGFILYVITTIVLVFAYPGAANAPAIISGLWDLGALMILVGAVWFFLYLRVNVAYDGKRAFGVGRADLFVLSLIGSAAFALLWHLVQSTGNIIAILVFFAIYLTFSTLLFISVPWSKFAHMFYKPAVAFQRKVEEANGSSDLPNPAPRPDLRR